MNSCRVSFLAAAALCLPSAAFAGSPYIGIEGGILFPRANDVDEVVRYEASQFPATPLAAPAPSPADFDDVFGVGYKRGHDVDLITGYDFGFFRLELELGHKAAGLKQVIADDSTSEFLTEVNSALNRPSTAPDPGAPSQPALTIEDFGLDGKLRVASAMLNGLVDVGVTKQAAVYAGGGYGRTRGKALGDTAGAWAWQYMVGARYAVSSKVELGLKYRYFNSGVLKLQHDPIRYSGNPNRVTVTPPLGSTADIDRTVDAVVSPEIEGRFRSRNLLASLIFKL